MEELRVKNKRIKATTLISAIVFILTGICLMIWHEQVTRAIGYLFGACLLMFGGANLYSYFRAKEEEIWYHNGLVIGGILAVAGIMTFVRVETVISIIPTLFGICIILNGMIKLQNAVTMYRLAMGQWKMFLITAVIAIVFGIVLWMNPFKAQSTLIMCVGIAMLVCGILDIVSGIYGIIQKKE